MKSYCLDDLSRALQSLGLQPGGPIMIHSALFALGVPQDLAPKNLPSALIRLFQSSLDESATLIVPTFTFQWCRGELFDRQRTASVGMGVFSEQVRRHPNARRSPHPIQSVAALGAQSDDYTSSQALSAFAPNGPFDQLVRQNGQLLCLGCSLEAISLVHWAEELVQVPYRYYKSFTGPYRNYDRQSRRTFFLYARDEESNLRVHLAPIEALLRNRGLLRKIPFGHTHLLHCYAQDFANAALTLLRRDPLSLVYHTDGEAP